MLPLSTEATLEARNVPTDRRHAFNTNDHNRFGQFEFTQLNIVVNTDEREEEHGNFEWKKESLRHLRLCYNQCFSVMSIL